MHLKWKISRTYKMSIIQQGLPIDASEIESRMAWAAYKSGGNCSKYLRYFNAVIILLYFIRTWITAVSVNRMAFMHFSPTFRSLQRKRCWISSKFLQGFIWLYWDLFQLHELDGDLLELCKFSQGGSFPITDWVARILLPIFLALPAFIS